MEYEGINEVVEGRGNGENFQRGVEKFQNAKRAGPVADQPGRLRTPPGVGGEGWPVSLLCSRNARPQKGLVGRAQ
jgi:hypothetical protein